MNNENIINKINMSNQNIIDYIKYSSNRICSDLKYMSIVNSKLYIKAYIKENNFNIPEISVELLSIDIIQLKKFIRLSKLKHMLYDN